MSNVSIYKPYTYLIGWTSIDRWYYGIQYGKNCHPDNLWVSYFTSSKVVAKYRKLYGEPDIIKVKRLFNTEDEARLFEHNILKRLKVKQNKRWLNQAVPGMGWNQDFRTEEWCKSISEKMKGIPKSSEHAENISKARKGMKFSDEHKENIRIACTGVKQSESTKNKRSKSISTLRWWNNGERNIRAANCPGEDYSPGRIKGWKWKPSHSFSSSQSSSSQSSSSSSEISLPQKGQ